MATRTGHRVGIWIIAVVMLIGTVGLYASMILSGNEADKQAEAQQKALAEYEKMVEAQRKLNRPLDGYSAQAFDKASVTELKVETLKEGDGPVANASSTVKANYFGWTSDGKIFDSTTKFDEATKQNKVTPIDFGLDKVITGWTEGLTGVKQGSVVKLMIPSSKAYGDTATQPGTPTGPLAFIVELVEVK